MAYIHELPEWPEFTWNTQALAQPLAAVRHKQGKHLGKMEALGFELRAEANLAALNSGLMSMAFWMEQKIGESMSNTSAKESLPKNLSPAIDRYLRTVRQIDRLAHLDQMMNPRSKKA